MLPIRTLVALNGSLAVEGDSSPPLLGLLGFVVTVPMA